MSEDHARKGFAKLKARTYRSQYVTPVINYVDKKAKGTITQDQDKVLDQWLRGTIFTCNGLWWHACTISGMLAPFLYGNA
jgi:hypothetical protein